MKKNIIIFACLIMSLDALTQTKSKIWFDGKARAIYNRDVLTDSHLENDTVSSLHQSSGYTALDLGVHFNPNDNVEVFSEVRFRNNFEGFWGQDNFVELRRLSLKSVISDGLSIELGDIFLKQSKFTLYNYESEIYERASFVGLRAYDDLINSENLYYKNFWRMHAFKANMKLDFYNYIDAISLDFFTSRIKGQQWLGNPELLMTGFTTNAIIQNDFQLQFNFNNSFEMKSTSLQSEIIRNPIFSFIFLFKKKINGFNLKLNNEVGKSSLFWENSQLSSKLEDYFNSFNVVLKNKFLKLNTTALVVGPDYRSLGAQTKRINFNSAPSAYRYIGNIQKLRPISFYDILSDPQIYNQNLSPLMMVHNVKYEPISPFGDATPNRIGIKNIISYNHNNFVYLNSKLNFYSEIIGQGTDEKRNFSYASASATIQLDKITNLKNSNLKISYDQSKVDRSGNDYEQIDLTTNLLSYCFNVEFFKKTSFNFSGFNYIAKGNEFESIRNDYTEIFSFSETIMDSKEKIYSLGLQYDFNKKTYFNIQYNFTNNTNNINSDEDLQFNRILFVFNIDF